ncbi:MAG: ABC transporter permease [Verrucomicrobiaceae bacterium]|nr:ABC transporter permease [Verrucomicrobiaceae bacterium]
MLRFLISRVLQGIVVIFAVLCITFLLLRMAPGGPFDRDKEVPEHVKASLERQYGLDQPWYVQLYRHLKSYATLDLPDSYRFKGMGVGEIIAQGFPISAKVGLAALGIALLIGVPAGSLAALRVNTFEDRATMLLSSLGLCLPSLVLGPVMATLFGVKLRWFNAGGWYDADDWVLPSLTLGIIYSAYIARLMRTGLRETLSQDYIRTARAKGVSEGVIVVRHAAKLAVIPLINFLGPAAAGLLSGSFVTETVFQLPGLGQHFVAAAVNKDYTLAMATAAFYALWIVIFNLLVDVLQAMLNPRITLGHA